MVAKNSMDVQSGNRLRQIKQIKPMLTIHDRLDLNDGSQYHTVHLHSITLCRC